MKIIAKFILIPLLAITSCVYAPAGLAPSIEPLRDRNYKTIKAVQGKQSTISIFSLIPLSKPDYNMAIREALKGEPEGSSLINVRAYYRSVFLLLFTLNTLTVEGEVVKK